MQKYFVSYTQAVALKKLEFNEKCYGYFTKHEEFFYFDVDDLSSNYTKNMDNLVVNSIDELECTAPLKTQVFEWGRKKGYDTKVQKESEELYFGFYWNDVAWIIVGNGSYEEAESACVDKLIELEKNKI